jgi:hypothetical protein
MRDEEFTDDQSEMVNIHKGDRNTRNDTKNNTLFTYVLSKELASNTQVLNIN